MFLISAINTISFVLVGNLILGIRGLTWPYWIILFTTSCSANLLGLNISSAFNSVITIYILIPFVIIPQLLFSGLLVKYDKLHRSVSSNYEYVPVIGELMSARWSFEALAVTQFRDNRFERNFFNYDMDKSQNNWYASFLIPSLMNKARVSLLYTDSVKYKDIITDNFHKLDKYTGKLSNAAGFSYPEMISYSLDAERFDPVAEKNLMIYLDSLKRHFLLSFKKARDKSDSVAGSLTLIHGREWLVNLKNNYENEQLAALVLGQNNKVKILETSDKIIQRYEPCLMKPVSQNGRAHFYAPFKKLGTLELDTVWFNIAVIWLVTLLLYVALYFKLLRRVVTLFESRANQKNEPDKLNFTIEPPV